MGRRREFDVDEALDAALAVFWRKGFEGTSYADLTAATGVERPGLYAAFGNKEALFRRAVERYYTHYLSYLPAAMEAPTSREVAARLLSGAVELCTRYPDRTGCFAINGALEEEPELVNADPYNDGWFYRILPQDLSELESLLSADEYAAACAEDE